MWGQYYERFTIFKHLNMYEFVIWPKHFGNKNCIFVIWYISVEKLKSRLLWPRAACIGAASLVSRVAELRYKADKAIYGVKWTIFFCLYVFVLPSGWGKTKKKSHVAAKSPSLKKKKEKTHTTMKTEKQQHYQQQHTEHRAPEKESF